MKQMAYRLRKQTLGDAPVVGRWGGVPPLAPHQGWPLNQDGEPLHFLGLLDLQALHAVAPLPDWMQPTGHLLFFYDVHHQPGYGPGQRAGWRLWHLDAPHAQATPPEGVRVFPEQALRAEHVVSLPSPDRPEGTAQLPWEDFLRALPNVRHQFLGYPVPIQDDDAEQRGAASHPETRPDDWTLLWAIDTDATMGWEWGDGGTLFVLVQPERVRQGQWAHAEVVLDCY